jgi:indole-3-glycerol phosphate synthase
MNVLDKIARYKRDEVAAAKKARPLGLLMQDARHASPPRGFANALEKARYEKRPGLIAEIKRASPSAGIIRADFHPEDLARDYDLKVARQATHLPVLRKDFMLEPYQIVQSRAMGADCILVILAMVKDATAAKLLEAARDWGMDAILEVHDEAELTRALKYEDGLIGINNRNLKTFVTDIATSVRLRRRIPSDRHVVAESGLSTAEHLSTLAASGISSYLIGESLMRAEDVEAATHSLLSGVRL